MSEYLCYCYWQSIHVQPNPCFSWVTTSLYFPFCSSITLKPSPPYLSKILRMSSQDLRLFLYYHRQPIKSQKKSEIWTFIQSQDLRLFLCYHRQPILESRLSWLRKSKKEQEKITQRMDNWANPRESKGEYLGLGIKDILVDLFWTRRAFFDDGKARKRSSFAPRFPAKRLSARFRRTSRRANPD